MCLLFLGVIRKDKTIRIPSLAVIVLTIGKVFAYEASELIGLFCVFSFLGLDLSLLRLSLFIIGYLINFNSAFNDTALKIYTGILSSSPR